jgi:hypothetical protein
MRLLVSGGISMVAMLISSPSVQKCCSQSLALQKKFIPNIHCPSYS